MSKQSGTATFNVQQQIVQDKVTGLSFQFMVMPDGTSRFRVFGEIPCGNREFVFNKEGWKDGSGIATTGACQPSFIRLQER